MKSAELEKGNKKSAKNVEVRVTVVNEAGAPIEVCAYNVVKFPSFARFYFSVNSGDNKLANSKSH